MGTAQSYEERVSPKDIVKAAQSTDFTKLPGWEEVAKLSANTSLRDIDVLDDIIIWEGKTFTCGLNVFINFQFPDDDNFPSVYDEFPGSFTGHIEKDMPIIDDISIDTTSFDG